MQFTQINGTNVAKFTYFRIILRETLYHCTCVSEVLINEQEFSLEKGRSLVKRPVDIKNSVIRTPKGKY